MKYMLVILLVFAFTGTQAQKQDGNFHLNKEYAISPTGTVRIRTSDAKIRVVGSSRTTAHVKIDRDVVTRGIVFGRDNFTVDVREVGGNVEIAEQANRSSIGVVGMYAEKYSILLEIPTGSSLLIHGDDDTYTIENVDGSIALRAADAHVHLTGCKGAQFEFMLDDGKLSMDQGKGKITIKGGDTDVNIQKASFSQFVADIDDGDLIVETSLAPQGNYSIHAQDGLVAMTITSGGGKFDVHHDDGRVSVQGGFSIIMDSDNDLQATLAKGESVVDIHASDARIKLVAH